MLWYYFQSVLYTLSMHTPFGFQKHKKVLKCANVHNKHCTWEFEKYLLMKNKKFKEIILCSYRKLYPNRVDIPEIFKWNVLFFIHSRTIFPSLKRILTALSDFELNPKPFSLISNTVRRVREFIVCPNKVMLKSPIYVSLDLDPVQEIILIQIHTHAKVETLVQPK